MDFLSLFEDRVAQQPQQTAAVFQGVAYTYVQLDAQANQLAHYLQANHPSDSQRVMVVADRHVHTLVGLLATLKTGSAFIPVDPHAPQARFQAMVEDASPSVILTRSEHLAHQPSTSVPNFALDLQLDTLNTPTTPLGRDDEGADDPLAYILYTSGTTGQPKGVMVGMRSFTNYLRWANHYYFEQKAGFPFAWFTPLTFDLTITSIFTPLLRGDAVHIFDGAVHDDLKSIFAPESPIKAVKLTPSHVSLLGGMKTSAPGIEKVILGGEPLTQQHVDVLQDVCPQASYFNEYGPTEATVGISVQEVLPGQDITVGRPIGNARIYVLNEEGLPQSAGVTGELYLGGIPVAKGYLNRPELTQQAFLPDPFKPGSMMYRSGDLGYWREDKQLELVGRADEQIKLRGYRIEPAEICEVLNAIAEVEDSRVWEHPKGSLFAALVVADTDKHAAVEAVLQATLSAQLPEYMHPSQWILVSELPITANGKLDKQALVEEGLAPSASTPSSQTEDSVSAKLQAIWEEVLGHADFGPNDSFFQSGGHSLLAIQLSFKIQESTGVSLLLDTLFDHPTLAGQANILREQLGEVTEDTSLQPLEEQEHYPSSYAQKRLWMVAQFAPSATYNIYHEFTAQSLDRAALQAAWVDVLARHEILRTVFRPVEMDPRQQVLGLDRVRDTFHWVAVNSQEEADAMTEQERQRIFATDQPLIRLVVVQSEGQPLRVIINAHHLVTDETSNQVLFRELLERYRLHEKGSVKPIEPLHVQYKEYAVHNGELDVESSANYWQQQLSPAPPRLPLPEDYERPAEMTHQGAHLDFPLSLSSLERLQALAKTKETTLFVVLQTAVLSLLHRYTQAQDLVLGTPVNIRDQWEWQDQMGFYVNTLALRTQTDPTQAVSDLIDTVKKTTQEGLKHSQYPFDKVVENLRQKRNLAHHPIFDTVLVVNHQPALATESDDPEGIQPVALPKTSAKYDQTFYFRVGKDRFNFSIEYRTDLYQANTMRQVGNTLCALLDALPDALTQTLAEYSSAPVEGKSVYEAGVLHHFPQEENLVSLWDQQVAKNPAAIALRAGDQSMSYGELQAQANQVAHQLLNMGVGPESRVVLATERNTSLLVAIWGILKAGGAYVPVDPTYPRERIGFMLDDAAPTVVLTDKANQHIFTDGDFPLLVIDAPEAAWRNEPKQAPAIHRSPSQLAYIIYTSGSTGKPKGVMVEDQQVVRLFFHEKTQFSFTDQDVWLLFHSYSFDFSVWEMYGALLFGGRLVILNKAQSQEATVVAEVLAREQVTILNQTPSAFYVLQAQMLQQAQDLAVRQVIFGGEALNPAQIRPWMERYPRCEMINMYGITETTVHVTYKKLTLADTEHSLSNIGVPIPTLGAYILDEDLNPVPVGTVGELYISGAGVARGYWNRPTLTADRFLENPYRLGPYDARLYRTGDLAKCLPTATGVAGDLEYLGRADHQVKIRGYRIELGEIETVLVKTGHVTQAVVIAAPDPSGNNILVAYVVPGSGYQKDRLLEEARQHLMEYMVPALVMELDSIPLTTNGKVDRKALPDPAGVSQTADFHSDLEELIAQQFIALLPTDEVGRESDYFELGGHSLSSMQLSGRLTQALGIEIGFKDVFRYPTVAAMAEYVQAQRGTESASLSVIEEQAHYPLTPPQRRLWLSAQIDPTAPTYHIFQAVNLEGSINQDALEKALRWLIDRHESLRTVFTRVDGVPRFQLLPTDHQGFSLAASQAKPEEKEARMRAFRNTPFDLAQGPLVRYQLLQLSAEQSVFMVTLHHIISDAWSMRLWVQELLEAYTQFSQGSAPAATPITYQYKDWASHLQEQIQDETGSHQAFWHTHLKPLPELAELPSDHQRPLVRSTEGATAYFTWDASLVAGLRQLAKQQDTSLFMVMLTGLQVWLHRQTQQDDVVMGTTVAGRHHQALEPLMGFFVNVLAIRSTLTDRTTSFAQALGQTKENLLAAYDHQDYPFDQLVDELELVHDSRHQPLFDVLVEYLHADLFQDTPEQLGTLQVQDQHLEGNEAKFELTFHFLEEKEGLKLAMEYRRDLWEAATIDRWFTEIQQLFASAVAQPNSPAPGLNMLADGGQALQTLGQGAQQEPALSVIAQFEAITEQYPDEVAITEGNETTTYAALNQLASQAAHGLREEHQVGLNDRVVLLLPRSTEVLVMLLAIQKLGATFVLLDVDHPAAKWKAQLQMAKPKVVITTLELALQLEGEVTCPISLADLNTLSGPNNLPAQQEAHTAYLLFTSGSTGNAKGVSIPQSAFSHYIQWANQDYFQNQRGYAFPLFTSLAFDLTLTSMFSPLTRGDQVVVIAEDNPIEALQQVFQRTDLGAIKLTPSHLRLAATIAQPNDALKVLIVGGEALEWAQVETARGINPNMAIYNEYGPTEATVGCCVAKVDHTQSSISIGKPVPSSQLVLLDSEQALVPQGAIGELYVGGPQVADGYFENPTLTDQAFMELPHVGKGIYYRTGDFARWDEKGDLHYKGRKEDQYKLNGYRVAPEEVEEALQKVPGLSQSVVGIRTWQDRPTLICWYLGESLAAEATRESLRDLLPAYMIPQHFVQVTELPVTENGKLNRQVLPDPVWDEEKPVDGQQSTLEEQLIQVWSEVLGKTNITTQDNFFDLGGTSLMLVEVNLKLAQPYPDLTITDLFNHPSLSKLAGFIQQNWGEDNPEAFQVVPLALPEEYFTVDEGLGEEKWEVALDAELIGRIQTLSHNHEVPLPSVVVAMFANILAQTSQKDLVEIPYLDEHGDIRNVSLDFANMESQAMLLETVGHSINGHPGKRALHQLVPPQTANWEVAPLISINTDTAEAELMQHFDLLLRLTPQVEGTWHLSLQYQPLRLNGHKVRGLMETLLDYLEAL